MFTGCSVSVFNLNCGGMRKYPAIPAPRFLFKLIHDDLQPNIADHVDNGPDKCKTDRY